MRAFHQRGAADPATLGLVGLLGASAVIAAITILAVAKSPGQAAGDFSLPPTVSQCAEAWNDAGNQELQTSVAEAKHEAAVVEGWQAKGRFGYCSIAFLETSQGGSWDYYVRWVSGQTYTGASRSWHSDTGGQDWGVDSPDPETPPPNASVQADGRVQLK